MSSNTQKLRVLRARTDHDLLILICRELDRGLLLVNVAATKSSPLFAEAQRAWEAAAALIILSLTRPPVSARRISGSSRVRSLARKASKATSLIITSAGIAILL